MPIPTNPPFLPNVLGYGADTLPILGTTPPGSGALSYQSGWPLLTSMPLEAGGIAPQREYFNAVNLLFSKHLHFLQSGGVYKWDTGLDYLKGCHVLGSNGQEYIAMASSGPNVPDVGAKNPVTDSGTYWKTAGQAMGAGGGGPVGFIGAFSGSFGGSDKRRPIPRGQTKADESWVLCDGGSDGLGGSVPDLRGRMILGASSAIPAGSVGGATTHGHSVSGSVGGTTLSKAQMPSHNHDIDTWMIAIGPGGGYCVQSSELNNTAIKYTGGSQSHSHSLTGASAAQASNMPPYYALAFIMRVA